MHRIAHTLSHAQLLRLLEAGRSLVAERELESVLLGVLEAARELTEARYAALGILDAEGQAIERFVHVGITAEEARRIGPLPRGRGVLGELIRSPKPLRLDDVRAHPRSYGFPAGHPAMTSFLGVPVIMHGEVFGNLYLTDKRSDDQFDDEDEHVLVVLAEWASVAIENARLYEEVDHRRAELERAVAGLEASVALSRVASPDVTLEWLLEAIAKRGRALVEACWFAVLRPDQDGRLEIAQTGGDPPGEPAEAMPDGTSQLLQAVLGEEMTRRVPSGEGLPPELGLDGVSAMIARLEDRDRSGGGFLLAAGALGREAFGEDDELLLASYASTAAGAIATVAEAERDRHRLSVQSSERERSRWARELHDETLQQLGAMKLMQQGALSRDDPGSLRDAVERSVAEFDLAIESLERMITDLRPAALDELGTAAALEALASRARAGRDERIELSVDPSFDFDDHGRRHAPELEETLYRIAQEALNNALKHAHAQTISIDVTEGEGCVELSVRDDGAGMNGVPSDERFGLRGIRERAELAGGELEVDSTPGEGTTIRVSLPVTG